MIVVTGGAGFLGRHVVSTLRERTPDRRLTVLDLQPLDVTGADAIRTLEGSVLDVEAVSVALEGPDAVVHLAAVVRPDSDDEERLRRVNVEGTRTVYRAAVDGGCGVFVHLSSSGVYGPRSRLELPRYRRIRRRKWSVKLKGAWRCSRRTWRWRSATGRTSSPPWRGGIWWSTRRP